MLRVHAACLLTLVWIIGSPRALAGAVQIKDKDGNIHTFSGDDIPACEDWALAEGSTCIDIVAITAKPDHQGPDDLLVRLLAANGDVLGETQNATGLYEFGGLPLADYAVSLSVASEAFTFATFPVPQTAAIAFELVFVPEPTTAALALLGLLAGLHCERRLGCRGLARGEG